MCPSDDFVCIIDSCRRIHFIKPEWNHLVIQAKPNVDNLYFNEVKND